MRYLSLSLVVVVLVATIGLGWVFDFVYQQYSDPKQSPSEDKIEYAEILTKKMAVALSSSNNANAFITAWQANDGYSLQIDSINSLALPAPLLSDLRLGKSLNIESDSDLNIHYAIPNSSDVLILQIPYTIEDNKKFINRYWVTSLFYLLLIVLFLLWAKPLISRLINLRETAKAFGKGELSQRITVGKVSYISDLESEFNHMAQRIEDLVSDVKLLSTAVSHDLRTPLARIRMGLDTLSEEEEPAQRRVYEKRINAHIDDMVELVETLLAYARLDQSMLAIEKTSIDLFALTEKIIKNKQKERPAEHDKSILLEADASLAHCFAVGDNTYLKMLVNNLLLNAIQHSKTTVLVKICCRPNSLVLVVEDDGDGIPEDIKVDLFKPFVRSKANKNKGHGVGLAICKRIVQWHQGSITVEKSEQLKGAKFIVNLPSVEN
ncbi:sensor histidine kinase [Glaciecola petra]|uniref:histidine kinase n=1 Tax=Glaciecola petra TaxID=3075602 RepID=A0ABU2ZTS8_9ALTE|nr:ATP-binding protein [Aestuariibacter sp. P117]MDT0596042.1 ATP-binding protein [Aestuariibacter sp. P117]